ncbi:MAG: GNAT family N-acetyltransferase [Thermoanaerobaculia bacterium]|nr:GNAT family N-acetyltransferase [Thermoanaerobaculia bacterium]
MNDAIEITTDPERIDLDTLHGWISSSYWAPGIPKEVVKRSIEGSIPFTAFLGGRQVGFARVVTDRATFAWLADVWVEESVRGKGIGHRLMEAVLAHPDLQALRRFLLATRDAHSLYAQYGFEPIDKPEAYMAIRKAPASLYGRSDE